MVNHDAMIRWKPGVFDGREVFDICPVATLQTLWDKL